MPDATCRLLVLSYHSWDTPPDVLRGDVAALRALGWRAIGREELLGSHTSGNAFLVTTDDGHVEDEAFFATLREVECPGITFVNVGRLASERDEWYRALAGERAMAVEDHGQWHRRHFVSSRITAWMGAEVPREDIAHLGLAPGHPLCVLGGEIALPRFTPDPAVADVVHKLASSTEATLVGGTVWAERVERELVSRRLASRRLGRLCLRGQFETWDEFESRVVSYVREGRRVFEQRIGVAPRLYSYTWWQGSRRVDGLLREAGYAGSFWGRDRAQTPAASTFGIPRIEMSPRMPRPMQPDRYRSRSPVVPPSFERVRALAKQFVGVR